MRITIRNRQYDIVPDTHSWKLAEVKVVQSGKNKGEEYYVKESVGYYTQISHLASDLYEYALRKADASSLQELAKSSKEIKEEILKVFTEFDEAKIATVQLSVVRP